MSGVFSNVEQLGHIRNILARYIRLPFSGDTIPGAIMEGVLAHVRSAERLNTYDFVDVIDKTNHVGWQVKSTKAGTPVTWKRAKIPSALRLIKASRKSKEGLQALGDAIIGFCNQHAIESLKAHKLNQIGYSRLVIGKSGQVVYFEKLLCTRKNPQLFNPQDFVWRWSQPKKTIKKEQLTALHGIHRSSGKKWWAWHGLGENQLHFCGEGAWWPTNRNPHAVVFGLPSKAEKLRLEDFMALLDKVDLSA